MKNFKEYYLQEDEQLDEDITQIVADIFGYTTSGIVVIFGASLIGLGLSATVKGLVKIWRQIIANFKSLRAKNTREVSKEFLQDPKVKNIIKRNETRKNEFEEELGELFSAIEKEQTAKAKEEYDNLNETIKNLPEVKKVIVQEITKFYGPPLYYKSPGSKGYQAIKKIIDIKTARAAAFAAQKALEEKYERSNEEI